MGEPTATCSCYGNNCGNCISYRARQRLREKQRVRQAEILARPIPVPVIKPSSVPAPQISPSARELVHSLLGGLVLAAVMVGFLGVIYLLIAHPLHVDKCKEKYNTTVAGGQSYEYWRATHC